MKNWRETILSQFDNSPRLLALLSAFDEQVDPAPAIDAFYAAVFDPRTAFGWGLDVWGRIVGVERIIELAGIPDAFGFDGSDLMPFGQGPFYSEQATTTYTLGDDTYRLLIFCKAAINISDGTLADLNRIMQWLLGDRGSVAVLHTGTMQIRFLFRFSLLPYEQALLTRDDVPPKPAGVGYDVYAVPKDTFGFFGSGLMPFGQGAFVKGGAVNAYSL